ncbi:ArsR/SmtB family transcription factor [Rhizobium tubonense]|uniref:Transcriptional regulator n=1 Tax=Rhizobium tubonense TaxID=484088 RepID=A0A2W4C7U6_9HYPH|nr:metalloregulator ArsR/SmtB family transcription factor [Rhizobium tubonense]PZM09547.1 transcriptional regulator [Rhizobium tubonense]
MSLSTPPRRLEREDYGDIAAKAYRASTLLKALSHEMRLLILCILADREKTVGEIEGIVGIQQAVVSQHLARLRSEGLVETRRDGRLVFYRLVYPEIRAVIASLHDVFRLQTGESH